MAWKNKAARKAKYLELKTAAFSKLGNRCASSACRWINADGSRGCTDVRCLQLDHIHGDGNIERREHSGDYTFYKRVLEDTDNRYQLLCSNCNWIKLVENNERTKLMCGSIRRGANNGTAIAAGQRTTVGRSVGPQEGHASL